MSGRNERAGTWNGDFGIRYTNRNKLVPERMIPFYSKILKDINVKRILEVGCNRGHNLVALSYVQELDLYGIDINPYSILLARENKDISFNLGDIFDILYKDSYFDLVLSSGVLIHIPPSRLTEALSEVMRVSKRYFLMLEYNYDFEEFEKVEYRENVGFWRGNFKKVVIDNFNVRLILEGKAGLEDGFGSEREYFLFEKTN
jgi:SAM-dependent methyltransferase